MQGSWSCMKDAIDFINKTKNLKDNPEDALLVMAVVVGLCPNILHEAGLKELRQTLDKRESRNKSIKKYGPNMHGRICFQRKLLLI